MIISEELGLNVNTVMSEASAEALIIAVAAMIEENNKALLTDLSSM